MRLTQTNLFNSKFCGIGPQSNDLDFPDYQKLGAVFGYPYYSIKSNDEMDKLDNILTMPGALICEVFVTTKQAFEPKSGTMILENGKLYSPPLEDMSPYLDRDELKKNMLD